MDSTRTCKRCGAALVGTVKGRVCPACLLRTGLAAEPGPSLPAAPTGEPAIPVGRIFGDYELLEEIARGGMGVVYKARQIGLNRIVALKMILSGKLASASERTRFRTEAETAARLQHPNIVAIHEVRVEEGNPFFSMDYVEGQTLAELVREGPLPAREAAVLVQSIAEAIHYAHGKGVLHRDLKPSNVILDHAGQPRITDFGLAKWLEGKSDLTVTGHVLGSPSFIPPEQARGDSQAVGPASDVYGLGALLYHLLAGRPPFVAETLTQTLRLAAETEPVSPRLLSPTLPRDLETICLKCLQKDPPRRYGTAQALAEDLDRFLRDEPIQARPIGPTARWWRWCRRNPALAVTLSAVIVLLLVVAIGSPIAAFRIDRERQRAEAGQRKAKFEATKSQQVAQFLKDMLKGVEPSVALGRDATMLREILDRTAERIGRDLKDEPAVQAELRSTIGNAYFELAEYAKAEAMQAEALRLRRGAFGATNEFVATSLVELANARAELGRKAEAETMKREALAMRRSLFGDEHLAVADSLAQLALALFDAGRVAEAEPLQREALAICRKLQGSDSEGVAGALQDYGVALMALGRPVEAEAACREAVAIERRLSKQENPSLATALIRLGNVLENEGKPEEAEPLCREAVAIRRKMLGNDHPYVASALERLASGLIWRHKLTEAEPLVREAVEIKRKIWGKEHPEMFAGNLAYLAGVLNGVGKQAEAEALCREALQSLKDHPPADNRVVDKALVELASILLAEEKFNEAESMARQCLEVREKKGMLDWRTFRIRGLLGGTLLGQRRFDEAEPVLLSAYQGLERQREKIPSWGIEHLQEALQRLVRLYEVTGRTNQAAEWSQKLAEFDKAEAEKKVITP